MDLVDTVAPVAASVATSAVVAAAADDRVAASAVDPVAAAVDANIAKDITAKLALNPEKSPYEVCKFVLNQEGHNISHMSANDNGYILFAGLVEIINKHLFMKM